MEDEFLSIATFRGDYNIGSIICRRGKWRSWWAFIFWYKITRNKWCSYTTHKIEERLQIKTENRQRKISSIHYLWFTSQMFRTFSWQSWHQCHGSCLLEEKDRQRFHYSFQYGQRYWSMVNLNHMSQLLLVISLAMKALPWDLYLDSN